MHKMDVRKMDFQKALRESVSGRRPSGVVDLRQVECLSILERRAGISSRKFYFAARTCAA
jgi:hypothetical protein